MAGDPQNLTRGPHPNTISAESYNRLLQYYRAQPMAGYVLAAKECGCTVGQARRAVEKGWPTRKMPAIRDLVAEEMAAGRRMLADTIGRERLRALNDPTEVSVEEERKLAAEQRAREGRLAQVSRDNALALHAVIQKMLRPAVALGERVGQALDTIKLSTPAEISFAVRVLRDVSLMQLRAVEAGRAALEVERVRLGMPSAVLGIDVRMTAEVAAERIVAAHSVLDRARALGLVALPGGSNGAARSANGAG